MFARSTLLSVLLLWALVIISLQAVAEKKKTFIEKNEREKLHKLLNAALQTTFEANSKTDETMLDQNDQALGPGRLECISQDEEILAEFDFGIQRRQAVSLRSL